MERAKQADEQASSLASFKALHESFIQYGDCDDGSIGEGYSDSVVRLLIADWPQIVQLKQMIDADPAFGAFILKHVDELMSPDQARTIDELSRTSCHKDAQTLCSAIENRIEQVGVDVTRESK